VPKHNAINAHGKGQLREYINAFVTSAWNGIEWSTSHSGCFIPTERAPGAHWLRGWMDLRHGLHTVIAKRKIQFRQIRNILNLTPWLDGRYTPQQATVTFKISKIYCKIRIYIHKRGKTAINIQTSVLGTKHSTEFLVHVFRGKMR
jgi:hypothetical protein